MMVRTGKVFWRIENRNEYPGKRNEWMGQENSHHLAFTVVTLLCFFLRGFMGGGHSSGKGWEWVIDKVPELLV
jgi:hypothetical protein